MMNNGMYSSKTDLWSTPQDFYDELNREFGFVLDACALQCNAKCKVFFSPDEDGLRQDWASVTWCNPPYGREIGKWVRKARLEAERGNTVVCLLPARTDTRWFHDYVLGRAEIRFLRGRLKFGGSKNSAPFPSMVAVFRPRNNTEEIKNE